MPRWALFATILAVSLLAHMKGITAPVLDYHYHRQANTASIARNYDRYGLPPWAPRIDWEGGSPERAATELPLYMWLVGLLWSVFGLGDVWGRLLSVGCSAATAAVLFAFLERRKEGTGWLETQAAFLAALAFSVLPVEVFFGRTVQPEAMALLGTLASFWALDRHLASAGGQAAAWWAVTVAAAATAIGLKLPYLYLLGVLGALCLARRGPRALLELRIWAVPAATLALVYAWYKFASAGVYVVPTTKDGGTFQRLFDYGHLPYFAFFQLFSRLPELALTYPGLVLFAAGARELLARRRLWFLGAWWLCVLVGIISGGGYSHHHDYTSLPWAPVNAAFIGAGFWSLWSAPKAPWVRTALLALALGMPLHAALRIHHWYRWSFPYLLNLKPAVERVSGPDDLFLCNERASSLVLYFIDRKGWSWSLGERGLEGLPQVDEAIARGAKYFLTGKEGVFRDPENPIAAAFLRRFPVVHDDANVLIFRLEEPRPAGLSRSAGSERTR